MARPKGTKYIKTPEELMQLWDDYKAQVQVDLIEQATSKGDVVTVAVRQPYLRSGFEAYVFRKKGFLVKQYLDNQDGLYDDYMGVITCIRQEWESDQVSGTLTGRYKAPNLTARLNGLTDKTETKQDVTLKAIDVKIIRPDGD
jgi:hypothetical protein